jgi:hypothetical protein
MLYDRKDYRRVFSNLAKTHGVNFIFADEKITNMHILQKIIRYIRASDFSLFDISSWNPNVTLELGIALATSDDWYICFNPDKTDLLEVPSDIRGIDRIQYSGFTDLEEKLTILLEQWYPKSERAGEERGKIPLWLTNYDANSEYLKEILGFAMRRANASSWHRPDIQFNEEDIAASTSVPLKDIHPLLAILELRGAIKRVNRTGDGEWIPIRIMPNRS